MAHVYPTGSGSSLDERLATMKTYFAFREQLQSVVRWLAIYLQEQELIRLDAALI